LSTSGCSRSARTTRPSSGAPLRLLEAREQGGVVHPPAPPDRASGDTPSCGVSIARPSRGRTRGGPSSRVVTPCLTCQNAYKTG
jgi:hypothetical protein